jgi:hypothetical protein
VVIGIVALTPLALGAFLGLGVWILVLGIALSMSPPDRDQHARARAAMIGGWSKPSAGQ